MLRHVQGAITEVSVHSEDQAEHAAVLELLLLVVYADRVVSQAEMHALEVFDEEHPDWDTATFSLQQQLGPATAAVRKVMASPEQTDALLDDINARIRTPDLRADVPRLCRSLAGIDGDIADREEALLTRIESRFT